MNSPFVAAGFKGRAARLGSADIRVAATLLGVEIAALMAVISVETDGSGFDWAGRPTILFEPHRFYRHLSGGDLRAAVQAGLAYPKWGEQPYPPTSDGNYARLIAACQINEAAGLMSASWGLGQIMGENFTGVGCASVQEMVAAAIDSEASQLQQLAAFIRSAGLVQALRASDWAAFARGFNGPGYAANHYDTKLAAYVAAHQAARPVAVLQPTEERTADDLNAAELARMSAAT